MHKIELTLFLCKETSYITQFEVVPIKSLKKKTTNDDRRLCDEYQRLSQVSYSPLNVVM